MKPLTLLAFALMVLATINVCSSHGYWYGHYNHRSNSHCCLLKSYYRVLYWKYRRQCRVHEVRKLKGEVAILRKAVKKQTFNVIQVPPFFKPLSKEELYHIRNHAINRLSKATFGSNSTHSLSTTTTTTTAVPTTTVAPTEEGEEGIERQPQDLPTSYKRHLKDMEPFDDMDDFEDDGIVDGEDEDESNDRRRKRREADEPMCPSPNSAASKMPKGTTAELLVATPTHSAIGNQLSRSCVECRYQITLPEGYQPRRHIHVVCPKSKQNCFGGFAKCVNNEIDLNVFQENGVGVTTNNAITIRINKGCSCHMLNEFAQILGDGN